jgi:imidazolonepropionase-like amidohydrolase
VLVLIDGEVYFERNEPRDAHPASPIPFATRPGAPTPAPLPAHDVYAIKDALIERVSGPPVRGNLVIERGKITGVGPDAQIPRDALVIEGESLVVAPALCDAGTALGLTEIGALSVSDDARDPGDLVPEVVAANALHPASIHFAVTRAAGVGLALSMPLGGLIPGQATLVRTAGMTPEELTVARAVALVVNWPSRPPAPPEGGSRPKQWPRREALEKFLDAAKRDLEVREAARAKKLPPPAPDPRLEAMAPYLRGERPVLLRADDARDIADAVAFTLDRGMKPVILGGRDAWKLARELAAKKVAVIYGPVLDLPGRQDEPYDACYSAPARLAEAGVEVAIKTDASGMAGPRNLPFEAIWAASYGLSPAKALEAVTLAPARIFGLDKERGSLDPGKAADVLVTFGDPLEPTSRVRALFIDGKPVDVGSKQSQLYETYKSRIGASNGSR